MPAPAFCMVYKGSGVHGGGKGREKEKYLQVSFTLFLFCTATSSISGGIGDAFLSFGILLELC
jgi:hypothetical protein